MEQGELTRDQENEVGQVETTEEGVAYSHQVGGHAETIKISGKFLLKQTSQQEIDFYAQIINHKISPHIPKTYPHDQKLLIKMENLTLPFANPCIMDCKVGIRLYGNDANDSKKQRMIEQAETTTSGTTGIRICGLKIQDPETNTHIKYSKEYGRSLTATTLPEGLGFFFKNPYSKAYNPKLIAQVIKRIEKIIAILKHTNDLHLYSASLLIIYEGCSAAWNSNSGDDVRFDVRLIDFAHSHIGETVDPGLLFGLENVVKYLNELALHP